MSTPLKTLLSALVLIALVAGGFYWLKNSKSKKLTENPYPAVLASKDQVIEGFPKELWLRPDYLWVASYKTELSGPDAYVLKLKTSLALTEVYSSYLNYLEENNYEIRSKIDNFISASQVDKVVNIAFASIRGETQVTITVNQ